MKEEESKEGTEVKPSKEKLNATETAAGSKPPGDKYSPKVRPETPHSICVYICILSYVLLFCSACQDVFCLNLRSPPLIRKKLSTKNIQYKKQKQRIDLSLSPAGAAGTSQVCGGRYRQL